MAINQLGWNYATHYRHEMALSAIGLTNWLNALPIVAVLVKSAIPLDRIVNGRISTVYAIGRGVNAMS